MSPDPSALKAKLEGLPLDLRMRFAAPPGADFGLERVDEDQTWRRVRCPGLGKSARWWDPEAVHPLVVAARCGPGVFRCVWAKAADHRHRLGEGDAWEMTPDARLVAVDYEADDGAQPSEADRPAESDGDAIAGEGVAAPDPPKSAPRRTIPKPDSPLVGAARAARDMSRAAATPSVDPAPLVPKAPAPEGALGEWLPSPEQSRQPLGQFAAVYALVQQDNNRNLNFVAQMAANTHAMAIAMVESERLRGDQAVEAMQGHNATLQRLFETMFSARGQQDQTTAALDSLRRELAAMGERLEDLADAGDADDVEAALATVAQAQTDQDKLGKVLAFAGSEQGRQLISFLLDAVKKAEAS